MSEKKGVSETITTVVMCLSTVAACFLSYFVWKSEERANAINEQATQSSTAINEMNMELERYRQTIQLCDKITALYKSYNTPTREDIVIFKLWEMGEQFDVTSLNGMDSNTLLRIEKQWDGLSKEERINLLAKNSAVVELFYFFEDAMMLHGKGLLDIRYFNNYISNIIGRLQKTTNPSVDEYIKEMCHRSKRNDIWEGFYCCCDNIMLESIIVPHHSDDPHHSCLYTARYSVKKGDIVERGDTVIKLYKKGETTPSVELRTTRGGCIDKIIIENNEEVTDGQVLVEIAPL